MTGPTPAEILHERLKAFLLFLKPRLLQENVDRDRLDQLRRLSDVRIRKHAVGKPQIMGLDLCALLSDPRSGRFDDLAGEAGLLAKGHLALVIPTLGEDMGYLTEACLTLQVIGPAAMRGHAKAFAEKQGPVAAPAGTAPAAAAKPAAAPVAPGVVRLLAPFKDLWTLPPAASKALALLAVADSPPDAVCAEIERDPALAAAVLRFVNASAPAKSSSVKRAVVALGYPLLRRQVLTAALASKLGPPYAEAGFDERAFWLSALRTAQGAAQVSRATRLGSPDEHFSAGLRHGIGRLAQARAGGPPADAPEAAVGAAILERWRLPGPVVEAARHAADRAEQLEELQLPREAVVVASLRALASKPPSPEEIRTWAGFLRVAADSLPSLLDQASKAAAASVAELFP
ncbi:MAG: HDOD domain-containing protein [Planctomycetes bacterium]|nr:HDOD domain-containing protein [Planctomycetota bacterium]